MCKGCIKFSQLSSAFFNEVYRIAFYIYSGLCDCFSISFFRVVDTLKEFKRFFVESDYCEYKSPLDPFKYAPDEY